MFSGKSSELIRRLSRFDSIGRPTMLVTSTMDTREYTTHDGRKLHTTRVSTLRELLDLSEYKEAAVVGIDEAQFFPDLLDFIKETERKNKTVILAGLDGDCNREPFGQILLCIPLCDEVVKLTALDASGSPAIFTRKKQSSARVHIGGAETYEAVSRKTWIQKSRVHV